MAGAISFNQIPGNWKQPLFWCEIDPSMAGVYIQQLPALLTGQMFTSSFSTTVNGVTYTSPAGTATPNVPIAVGSPAMANELFGTGSVLAQMFAAFFRVNAAQEVWGLPISDPSGAQATGTITVAGPATLAGTINLYIAGQQVLSPQAVAGTATFSGQLGIAVSAGDTANTIASNIANAINYTFTLPVTASVLGAVVTLTAKHKGLLGNDIVVMDSYYGTLGGQSVPLGVTLTYSNQTSTMPNGGRLHRWHRDAILRDRDREHHPLQLYVCRDALHRLQLDRRMGHRVRIQQQWSLGLHARAVRRDFLSLPWQLFRHPDAMELWRSNGHQ